MNIVSIIIGIVAGIIAGPLAEYLLMQRLPKNPTRRHTISIIIAIVTLVLIAALVELYQQTEEEAVTNINECQAASMSPELVLFQENFEDDKLNGFIKEQGDCRIVDESDNKVCEISSKGELGLWPKLKFGSEEWKNYTVKYRIKLSDFDSSDIGPMGYMFFRGAYLVSLNPFYDSIGLDFIQENSQKQIEWKTVSYSKFPLQPNIWYSMLVKANGSHLEVFLNDDENPRIKVEDTHGEKGSLAIGTSPNTVVHFDDICVIEIE